MITVSDAYKAAVLKNFQEFSIRVEIDYSDYNIDNSITTTVDPADITSDGSQMADGIETPSFEYIEWNTWEWGRHMRSQSATTNEKGALSAHNSESDGSFATHPGPFFNDTWAGYTFAAETRNYPSFRINFSSRTVTDIKAVFDNKLNEYATIFDVNVYTNDYETPEHTENVTGNTSYRWTTSITAVEGATAVEIVVKEWNTAGVKAKVIESFTAYQEKYGIEKIDALSIYEEMDSAVSTNPVGSMTANTLNLKMVNIDSWFDNENEDSPLAGNVTKNRRIKAYMTINDTDEISLGAYYSDSWVVKNKGQSVEVSARDIIQLMADREYNTDQFITPGVDQTFTYTTTAEFATFTTDNTVAENNSLRFGGSALLCSSSLDPESFAGYTWAYTLPLLTGWTYCGTAEKTINYTYTPGVSVTVNFAATETKPLGTNILYYVSYKDTEEFNLINGNNEFTFTPEDPTDTSQTIKIQAFFITQSTEYDFSLDSLTVTISEKITLYSLAAKIIEDFDGETNLIEGRYIIDQSYADYEIAVASFKPQKYRDALKKIVEAGGGRAYQRRDQYLIIDAFESVGTPSKTYTDSMVFDETKPVNPWTLYNRVTVKTYDFIQAASAEALAKVEISILDTEVLTFTIEFEKAPADTITNSGLPAGVTVTDSTIYTWGVVYEITNASGGDEEFTLTVNGKPYELTGNKSYSLDNTESTRKFGVNELIIDNDLIQTQAQAEAIAENLINSLSTQRREISMDALPDPALLLGDTIEKDSNFYILSKSELQVTRSGVIHQIGGKR